MNKAVVCVCLLTFTSANVLPASASPAKRPTSKHVRSFAAAPSRPAPKAPSSGGGGFTPPPKSGGTPIHFGPPGSVPGGTPGKGGTPKGPTGIIIKGSQGDTTPSSIAFQSGDSFAAQTSCLSEARVQGTASAGAFSGSAVDRYLAPSRDAHEANAIIDMLDKLPVDAVARLLAHPAKSSQVFHQDTCRDTEQTRMCQQLLTRAITDEQQAHYRPAGTPPPQTPVRSPPNASTVVMGAAAGDPAVDGVWQEIATWEKAQADAAKISVVPGKSDVLARTGWLVAQIDKALAFGDSARAGALVKVLRNVNPSAAQGLECLLGPLDATPISLSNGNSTPATPGGKPKIGPITGTDYGASAGIDPTHAVVGVDDAMLALGVMIVGVLLTAAVTKWQNSDKDKQAELNGYLQCKQAGGLTCKETFKDAAAAEAAAEQKANAPKPSPTTPTTPTTTPSQPPDSRPLDPFTPSPLDTGATSTPPKGSGGSAGELAPPDLSGGKSPIAVPGVPTRPSRSELDKTRDPHASEQYCKQVVADFQSWQRRQTTATPVDSAEASARIRNDRLFGGTQGPLPYDMWTNDVWKQREQDLRFDAAAQEAKQNCQVRDPARR